MIRRASVLAAVALACGAQCVAAAAGTVVPSSVPLYDPELTVAADGEAVVAWTRGEPVYVPLRRARAKDEPYEAKIQVALGSIDGGFPIGQTLATLHNPNAGAARLAGDRAGNAIAAWQDDQERLRFAVRRRGGLFGESRVLAKDAFPRQLVAGPRGVFVLAWLASGRLHVASGTAADGFGPAATLPARDPTYVGLAVNRRGTVMALAEGASERVWLRRPGRDFKMVGRVPGWTTSGVSAALQPDDSVVAVLSGYRSEVGLAASYRKPGGVFTKPRLVDRDGAFPEVAVDPRGSVTAAWTIYDQGGSPRGVAAATAPPRGHFRRVRRYVRWGAWGGALAVAGNGRRLLAFGQNGSPSSLRSLAWQRRGDFGAPSTVESGSQPDHVAGLADDGRGLVVWVGEGKNGREQGLFFAVVGEGAAQR